MGLFGIRKVFRTGDREASMGAQEKSQGNSNSLQRSEELALYVFDQEDNETLLVHRICPDDIYRKQEGTRSVTCNEIYISVLSTTVTESGIADQMRLTVLILNDQDFFQKLVELFRICEDLENMDGLHMIFKIVKGIILLNSAQIFEKIFGDELIRDIIGSLECNYITICLQIYYQGLLVD
ncbi:serine/threonine-protein phosphatase 4 regulatory subunit 3 isoform X2 [Gossypium hirsutum]|uniref:Serine/threonine-protein phosphatase 4 regulatory subunit 3 isoform X2 n=1 Tax=Gossypium hirsutum TaxID=3635 RepID=A0A1U8LUT1_GOSHI|nr:serine/threonine-protein phosphatase 4 regulatory subunit 3 isoform X2 [Gossypium hirsutum]